MGAPEQAEEGESHTRQSQRVQAALVAAAEDSEVSLRSTRWTASKPTCRTTTLQNILGITDAMRVLERSGDAVQKIVRVPMSRAQFEQLIKQQEEQYVVHLAP